LTAAGNDPPDSSAAQATSARQRRSLRIGVLCAIGGAMFFSAKAILVKLIYAYGVDATTTFALRMFLSLPFFIALALWCGRSGLSQITRRDWLGMLGCGFLGFYLSSYLDFLGLSYIPASLERLILFLWPTVVVILSWLLYRTALNRTQAVSLLLSYSGVALVVWQSLPANLIDTASGSGPQTAAAAAVSASTGAFLLGVGFTFASALCYATYVVTSARIITRLGTLRFTAYASSIACGFSIAHFLLVRDFSDLVLPVPVYLYGVAMAILATVMPILLVAEALRRIGANQVALISSIGPVTTIGLAWLILGETITGLQIVGAALVILGVLLVSLRKAAPAAS
jgi:drug/metabolite transporter (DMT)-like permease